MYVPSYTVFGLTIESSVPIRHLLPTEKKQADVRIISESLELPRSCSGSWYFTGDNGLYIHVPRVALFHVSKAQIAVNQFSQDDDSVDLYLTGSVFGALLYLRGFIPLHGCTVNLPGGVATFMGESGVGKSTVAATFFLRGYQLFADDVTAIQFQEDQFRVWPSPHRLRLLPETVKWLGIEVAGEPEALSGKFVLDGYERFSQAAATISELNFLGRGPQKKRRLQATEPFFELINNLYRPEFVDALALHEDLFSVLADLARTPSFSRQVPRYSCPSELMDNFVGVEANSENLSP